LVDLFISQLKTISHSHDLLWPTWWGAIEAWFAKDPWATELPKAPLPQVWRSPHASVLLSIQL
jgi:hypothetical protein